MNVRGGTIDIGLGSIFKSLHGSVENEFVGVSADGHLLGAVDLGDGDDSYYLFSDGAKYIAPTSANGGGGQDTLALVTSGQWDIDLSIYSGFERLGDGGNSRNFELTLRHANDFLAIDFGHRDLLRIVDSISPNAYVYGLDGRVEISASSIVGRFGFSNSPENHATMTAEPNALPSLNTELVNHGTILGDVQLYFGDDLYDGDEGSALGTVYGYAGNDILRGGMGSDDLSGGYGFDTLQGNGGDDVLSGDAGNDVIDGGSGADMAVYSVAHTLAVITHNGDGTLTIDAGAAGVDTVSNVEQFQFTDGVYSFHFAAPASVLVSNFAVGAGGWTGQDSYPRHMADVNGDGYADIIGFGHAGIIVAVGAANGSFATPTLVTSAFGATTGWTNDNTHHRELADVNGDGRADIIGFGQTGTFVALANTSNGYAAPSLALSDFGTDQGWNTQDRFARTTGDVDGDGKADIIGFGDAGTYIALGNGDGSFRNLQFAVANFGASQGWTSDNSFHREVADVNGDGKDDIIGFGVAGTYVATSNGDGSFADSHLALLNFGKNQGWSSQDAFARDTGDINGDGFADIVGFGTQGSWAAFGNASGSFTLPGFDIANFSQAQGWTSDISFHRELVDTNRDGFADIVGFGYSGVYVGLNHGDFHL